MIHRREGCRAKEQEEEEELQLTDDLLVIRNYTEMKKAAEDRSVRRTIRRVSHKPTST